MTRLMRTTRRAGLAVACAAAAALLAASPAPAQKKAAICASARADLAASPDLAARMAAAFGASGFVADSDENCLRPVKSLDYRDAVAVLAARGESCHACGARLSAAVLRRVGSRLVLARRFDDFAQVGSSGEPGTITGIALAGDDGFLIEHGGVWQGQAIGRADVFVFRGGRLAKLTARSSLPMLYSDAGFVENPRESVTVEGKWRIVASQIHVTYDVTARGRRRTVEAVWQVVGDGLRLVQGAPPPELRDSI